MLTATWGEEIHAKDSRQYPIGLHFAAPAAAAVRRLSRNADTNEDVVWYAAPALGTRPRPAPCIQRIFRVIVKRIDDDIVERLHVDPSQAPFPEFLLQL